MLLRLLRIFSFFSINLNMLTSNSKATWYIPGHCDSLGPAILSVLMLFLLIQSTTSKIQFFFI